MINEEFYYINKCASFACSCPFWPHDGSRAAVLVAHMQRVAHSQAEGKSPSPSVLEECQDISLIQTRPN